MARKTDDKIILQMLNEGKTQKEIAEHFNVSGAAICKRVKRILGKKPESFENMTEKEQKFALAIAAGKTQTQAALDSHECSSMDSAKSIGHQLMKKPDIQTAVAELMQEEGLTRRYRVQKLKTHIDHPDPNVSLKGLDQSWKLEGAYTEKYVHVHATYEDLIKNLEDINAEIELVTGELKEGYMDEIKKLHPEMDDETVSKMAEKTLNALFPDREEGKQRRSKYLLGADTTEGEVIEED
jgi:predicted transcriptional regulator